MTSVPATSSRHKIRLRFALEANSALVGVGGSAILQYEVLRTFKHTRIRATDNFAVASCYGSAGLLQHRRYTKCRCGRCCASSGTPLAAIGLRLGAVPTFFGASRPSPALK